MFNLYLRPYLLGVRQLNITVLLIAIVLTTSPTILRHCRKFQSSVWK